MNIKRKKYKRYISIFSLIVIITTLFWGEEKVWSISQTGNDTIPSEINNIVIFIRFSAENEFINVDRTTRLNENYNGGEKSLKTYIEDLTYNKSTVNSTFYPKDADGNYISYVDSKERNYYKEKSLANPIGYSNISEKNIRENELVVNATKSVSNEINIQSEKLDSDNDGYIDNVTYLISGLPEKHGDILWPHKTSTINTTLVNNKRVRNYNVLMQGTENVGIMGKYKRDLGVIVHEFLHTFNFPDLYRYSGSVNGENPVGIWDIMSSPFKEPQLPLAYTRIKYGQATDSIAVISENGSYELTASNTKDINEKIAYKIKSPLSKDQYFMVEYRKINDKWESGIINSNEGLLVYRIDETVSPYDGNRNGYPDHIYIFRPEATSASMADGNLNESIISPIDGEKSYGKENSSNSFDPDTIYFQDGTNSGIVINNIEIKENDRITFNVDIPKTEGTGIKENPFIIRTAKQFNGIRNNIYAHYKLEADVDMGEIGEFTPIEEFYGSINGNGYSVKNLKINKPANTAIAMINILQTGATINNIKFENILVIGGRMVSSIVGSNKGIIDNVEVEGLISSKKDWAGGIAQSNMFGGIIRNTISKVNVSGQDYLGGITSNNYGGEIINSIYLGEIKVIGDNIDFSKVNMGAIATRNYQTESKIENSFWDVNNSKVNKAVAVGDGDITKGTIGIKINNDIKVNELGESIEKIELIGSENDIVNSKVLESKIYSNSDIVKIQRINNNYLNKIEYSILAKDLSENTKIYYGIEIGSKSVELSSNIYITKVYEDEDVNRDKIIDILDIASLSVAYNSISESVNWNIRYDINKDNIIDIFDIVKVAIKL